MKSLPSLHFYLQYLCCKKSIYYSPYGVLTPFLAAYMMALQPIVIGLLEPGISKTLIYTEFILI